MFSRVMRYNVAMNKFETTVVCCSYVKNLVQLVSGDEDFANNKITSFDIARNLSGKDKDCLPVFFSACQAIEGQLLAPKEKYSAEAVYNLLLDMLSEMKGTAAT